MELDSNAFDATGDRPGAFDFVGRAKYDAWSSLAGKTAEQAMEDYIALVDERAGS